MLLKTTFQTTPAVAALDVALLGAAAGLPKKQTDDAATRSIQAVLQLPQVLRLKIETGQKHQQTVPVALCRKAVLEVVYDSKRIVAGDSFLLLVNLQMLIAALPSFAVAGQLLGRKRAVLVVSGGVPSEVPPSLLEQRTLRHNAAELRTHVRLPLPTGVKSYLAEIDSDGAVGTSLATASKIRLPFLVGARMAQMLKGSLSQC